MPYPTDDFTHFFCNQTCVSSILPNKKHATRNTYRYRMSQVCIDIRLSDYSAAGASAAGASAAGAAAAGAALRRLRRVVFFFSSLPALTIVSL